jgi:hypothetical protein
VTYGGQARISPPAVTAPPDAQQRDGKVASEAPGAHGLDMLSGDAKRQMAELLNDAVNHVISAGLELASVRGRLPVAEEQALLEHACDGLDATLADIRRLAVGLAQRSSYG